MNLENMTFDKIIALLNARRRTKEQRKKKSSRPRDWIPFSKADTLSLIRHFFRDHRERARIKGKLDVTRIDLRKARKDLRTIKKAGIVLCADGTIEIHGSLFK